jgi:DNA-binding beta-propeller fold protein YncE
MSRFSLIAFLSVGCATHGGSETAPPWTDGVSTLAGAANPGMVDGDRDVARFRNPVNIAVGPDGNIYVADFDNDRIRMVEEDGTTSTLIQQKGFAKPFGITFAGGTMYVTTDNDATGAHHVGKSGSVWRVDIAAKHATEIVDSIGMPRGIFALADGRLAVADYENHVVEIVDTHGNVTPLAGQRGVAGFADGAGKAAAFNIPYGLVQRSDGKLIVCDAGNNRLRLVGLDGSVSTLAGTGTAGFADGAMAGAMLSYPEGIAQDKSGTLYISDRGNLRVRRIASGMMDTIAGDGKSGYVDDDDKLASEFQGLEGISVLPDASWVYVADGTQGTSLLSNRVRVIKMTE